MERVYPYVIFLPKGKKRRVLEAVFGSAVPVEILRFAIRQGISEKIYQRDLIEQLGYSNRTVIEHLKNMTELGILEETMEKSMSGGRTVWLKSYTLTDLGRWFALLLVEEEELSREEKVKILKTVFRLYVKWIRSFSESLNMDKEVLREIFLTEIG